MEFKSAVTRGGNAILPEIIDISAIDVTWKKRNKTLISSDSISIPINAISSVEIDTSIVGTTIKINSQGQGAILATNFTAPDAKEIKRLIHQLKDDSTNNRREQIVNESNTELELKIFEEEKYFDIDRIPLITFLNNPDAIISELSKLIALKKHSITENETKKTNAYQNKINEGLRLLDSLDLLPQQIQIKDAIKGDLHNLIIQSNLFQGLKISNNNSEKLKTIFNFLIRYKWWTLFILSLIYVAIRNLINK